MEIKGINTIKDYNLKHFTNKQESLVADKYIPLYNDTVWSAYKEWRDEQYKRLEAMYYLTPFNI